MASGNSLTHGSPGHDITNDSGHINNKAEILSKDDGTASEADNVLSGSSFLNYVSTSVLPRPGRIEEYATPIHRRSSNSWPVDSQHKSSKESEYIKKLSSFVDLGLGSPSSEIQNLPSEIHTSPSVDHMTKVLKMTENGDKVLETSVSDHSSRADARMSQSSLNSRNQRQRLRLRERWKKLQSLRSKTSRTRATVCEKRSELQASRLEMSIADEGFMKLVREKRMSKPSIENEDILEEHFEKLQATRNEYGPLEEAYDTLEDSLLREEYELAQLERQVSKYTISLSQQDTINSDSQSSGSDGADSSIMEVNDTHNHPLYDDYLSRLGDLDLCREAHSDLLLEHDWLREAQERRQRVGMTLSPDDQATLANFPAEQAKILKELREIEADVERLRIACVQEGLLVDSDSDESDILGGPGGSVDEEQAEYNKFPLLLEKPEEDETESKSLISDFGDVGDRITRWLLHKLRSSCSEVELLARLSDGPSKPADNEKWQEEVLYFWFMDSANLPPSAYRYEPTITASPTSPLADRKKLPPPNFGGGQLIELVIRSSSLSHQLEFSLLLKLSKVIGKSAGTA